MYKEQGAGYNTEIELFYHATSRDMARGTFCLENWALVSLENKL